MTGRLAEGFSYSCAGALIAPRRMKWSHDMERYTVGQLMEELSYYQPGVVVVSLWGGRGGIQLDIALVEAILEMYGIDPHRDPGHTSPLLLAGVRPGWALLSRNPRRR